MTNEQRQEKRKRMPKGDYSSGDEMRPTVAGSANAGSARPPTGAPPVKLVERAARAERLLQEKEKEEQEEADKVADEMIQAAAKKAGAKRTQASAKNTKKSTWGRGWDHEEEEEVNSAGA